MFFILFICGCVLLCYLLLLVMLFIVVVLVIVVTYVLLWCLLTREFGLFGLFAFLSTCFVLFVVGVAFVNFGVLFVCVSCLLMFVRFLIIWLFVVVVINSVAFVCDDGCYLSFSLWLCIIVVLFVWWCCGAVCYVIRIRCFNCLLCYCFLGYCGCQLLVWLFVWCSRVGWVLICWWCLFAL